MRLLRHTGVYGLWLRQAKPTSDQGDYLPTLPMPLNKIDQVLAPGCSMTLIHRSECVEGVLTIERRKLEC
jgi:hypothetical protein